MDEKFFISENDDYAGKMKTVVEPWLREHGRTGYFKGWDGNNLFYEAYCPEGEAKGSVVVCHGFTESAEKFHEMFWYFLHMGYNVFGYDHRGHGRSYRYNDNPEVVAIRRFGEYVDDLNCFVNDVVKPASDGKKLFIYCHSMGGAVTVQYLQTYPETFSKAVLSAPMIAPRTAGIPYPVTKLIANSQILIGRKDAIVVGSEGFNPNRTYEESHDTSKARFEYYLAKKIADRSKQTSAPSYNWVKEAVKVTAKNLDRRRNSVIKIPVLLFQPAEDTSVFSDKENEFIEMVENGRLEVMPDSKHEIYMAVDSTVKLYLGMIEDFLAE